MNKVFPLLILLLVVVSAAMGGLYLLSRPQPPPWTSDSRQALEAFEQGLEALKKRYLSEAHEHFERAVELDPDFAMAHLFLARHWRQRASAERLRAVDASRLTPREALFIRYYLAHADGEHDEAEAMLARYLESHPDDPFALSVACDASWLRLDWDEAERCYQHLLERHPNWVEAQNRLGYLAMARGRFDEAEERFQSYVYIAPDQANPHDSLGELYMLLGRYDEAEEAFREALARRSDFCPSLQHLMELMIFAGEIDRARQALADLEAEEACRDVLKGGLRCHAEVLLSYAAGDFEGGWQRVESCSERLYRSVLPHRLALLTGRREDAFELEERLRAGVAQEADLPPREHQWHQAALFHVEASRLLADGRPAAAAELFARADELSTYWGDSQWAFKLYNRLGWLTALELAGRAQEAKALRRKIAAINPRFASVFHAGQETLAELARQAMARSDGDSAESAPRPQ
ncbi:MAG: tetratricopeptide repeat protein [Acidobacteria bacterium]|nr:MAG: tetratricopeptide repeat protein [Acidobacteriota bacterium]